MRVCQCGGVIRQHQLTGEREAWTCNSCGRYEAIERIDARADKQEVKEDQEKEKTNS
jgi:hypothetical protein